MYIRLYVSIHIYLSWLHPLRRPTKSGPAVTIIPETRYKIPFLTSRLGSFRRNGRFQMWQRRYVPVPSPEDLILPESQGTVRDEEGHVNRLRNLLEEASTGQRCDNLNLSNANKCNGSKPTAKEQSADNLSSVRTVCPQNSTEYPEV